MKTSSSGSRLPTTARSTSSSTWPDSSWTSRSTLVIRAPVSRRRDSDRGWDASCEPVVRRSAILRTSSQVVSPSSAGSHRARIERDSRGATRAARRREREVAGRAGSGGRSARDAERDLVLDPREAARRSALLAAFRPGGRRGARADNARRSAPRTSPSAPRTGTSAKTRIARVCRPGTNASTNARPTAGRRRKRAARARSRLTAPSLATSLPAVARERVAAPRPVAAARSSSRTCSSAPIASSFIAASTSWCENLAVVKRPVSRSNASGSRSSRSRHAVRYSSRSLGRLPEARDSRRARARAAHTPQSRRGAGRLLREGRPACRRARRRVARRGRPRRAPARRRLARRRTRRRPRR